MNLFIILGVVIVLIAAVVGIVRLVKRLLARRKQRLAAEQDSIRAEGKERLFRDLVRDAMSGNKEAREAALKSPFNAAYAQKLGLAQEYQGIFEARNWDVYGPAFANLVQMWRTLGPSNVTVAIDVATKLTGSWPHLTRDNQSRLSTQLGYHHDELPEELKLLFAVRYSELAAEAPTSGTSFNEMRQLLNLTQRFSLRVHLGLLEEVEHPESWNGWVVQHVAVPSFQDFVRIPGYEDRKPSFWLRYAAEALVARDVERALIMIATAHQYPHIKIRPELSQLLAELAVMAEEERQHRIRPSVPYRAEELGPN